MTTTEPEGDRSLTALPVRWPDVVNNEVELANQFIVFDGYATGHDEREGLVYVLLGRSVPPLIFDEASNRRFMDEHDGTSPVQHLASFAITYPRLRELYELLGHALHAATDAGQGEQR